MTTLLAGLATTFAALVGAWIAWARWRASRTAVVAEVRQGIFALPDAADEALQEADGALVRYRMSPDWIDVEDDDSTGATVFAALRPILQDRLLDLDKIWEVQIHNKGHKKAEEVALHIPGLKVVRIEKRGEEPSAFSVQGAVEIGDIRPGDKVGVLAWSRWGSSGSVEVVQSSGHGKVRMMEPMGPGWVAFASFVRFHRPLLFVGAVFLALWLVSVVLSST